MQTVDKAAGLLGHFSERKSEIGLSELARLAGYDKATTRRCLLSFMKHGIIEQDARSRAYRLGPEVLRLARVREASLPLDAIVSPLLDTLVECSAETAHFSVLAGSKVYTHSVRESDYANRISFNLGEESPIHATATGLVILANLNDLKVDKILQHKLPGYTAQTITDPAKLKLLLTPIREQGYYVNIEMNEPGVCSVAAPVFDASGEAIAAFGIAAPKFRFSKSAGDKMIRAVTEAAKRASLELGAGLSSRNSSPDSAVAL